MEAGTDAVVEMLRAITVEEGCSIFEHTAEEIGLAVMENHAEILAKLTTTEELMAVPQWRCINCKHVTSGHLKPDRCPACNWCQGFAEVAQADNLAADTGGFIVGNGAGDRWRAWDQGSPIWIDDRSKATRYHRREDAEAVHAEDEDAWAVIPFAALAAAERGA